jgi:acyl-homoserine lactone acylase PvdQ
MRGHIAAAALVAVLLLAAAPARAEVQSYATNDAGGFHDVLPPGTNGLANIGQLAAFGVTGARPPHNDDQLAMYRDLMYATPGLTPEGLRTYFKDSTFGVRPADVASTTTPRADVTIVRDKAFGVPHIYGTTRGGTMFGAGYAAAQDRLFFIDILRHLGRAELSSFIGGAPANREMDAAQWAIAPYTEADLERQFDLGDDLHGDRGRQLQVDAREYVAGVNRYIAEARLDPTKMPGEYLALGHPLGPERWKVTDLIATTSLVGGIFGQGGGRELAEGELLRAFTRRFGDDKGRTLWEQFAAFDDPDAPTTVRGTRFPYQTEPRKRADGAEALPDPGSFTPLEVAPGQRGGGSQGARPAAAAALSRLPRVMSNALLVSSSKSASGRPLAVFGPQVSYFAPEILMEEDLHGPGIDARGAAFPGVNLYVELGHGRDYAWSATSAGQDIIDTFAVPLCDDTHYRFRGQCLPIETLDRRNSWTPNPADPTPPGSETLHAQRTKLGLVAGRGTYQGRPVLYTVLRSTYMHEVDSALGFSAFNEPGTIRSAQDFQRAASLIGYTFNWFYVDSRHIAYFNSGNNPVRAKGTTGQLPMTASNEWRDYDPELNTARYTPFDQHPQVVDQPVITSWNNRQAQGYAGADTNLFSSVFRSQMLDRQIEQRLLKSRKLTLPGLVDAMEEAGSVDLRGMIDLPLALRVLGTPKDPALTAAAQTLRAWVDSGAHRVDRDRNGTYDHAHAVQIMDAWWPRLVDAMFEPVMGERLLDRLKATYGIDNEPNNHGAHLGSAYQTGFYGYVSKDLKRVLGRPVKQKYAVGFCGGGRRAACRRALEGSLRAALAASPAQTYPAEAGCNAGDQACRDQVRFRALGGITQPPIPWINRPTYQQAVEVRGSR